MEPLLMPPPLDPVGTALPPRADAVVEGEGLDERDGDGAMDCSALTVGSGEVVPATGVVVADGLEEGEGRGTGDGEGDGK
jgi:hypothetical protein